jgi:hypothetical protein
MTRDGSYAPAPNTIADLQQLTQEYAGFARSRAGLGNVLGGVVGLIVFGAVWRFGSNLVTAILAVGLTLVWLVGREVLRQRLYRRFGQARELWTGSQRRAHRFLAIILTAALLGFAVVIIAGGWLAKPVGWPYLIFCLVTPFIVWRSLFTIPEMILGFDLLFVSAIIASGHTPNLLGLLAGPAYALALIPLGLQEHRQFHALERRLQARGQAEP